MNLARIQEMFPNLRISVKREVIDENQEEKDTQLYMFIITDGVREVRHYIPAVILESIRYPEILEEEIIAKCKLLS